MDMRRVRVGTYVGTARGRLTATKQVGIAQP